ncbi:uncharacterized protein N7477_002183 [Penicillium maclennaniae]|uniref:uncharacterized protein n=1 Tax=Penicillium maclennaniae TaxID=1343394 RepID=UPI002541D0C5|nr:uncharacterized protein N7477_002183 [Penicillium maclennaniae]KAJ5676550.1 hypothetical protein N7477_002183 [Penicillium maclennaniae]
MWPRQREVQCDPHRRRRILSPLAANTENTLEMSFTSDPDEKVTDHRFERKMVTIAPSAPTGKRPIRKPTVSVQRALRKLQQSDLVDLLNDVQEERITLVHSTRVVEPGSVATYFHSPSSFTFFFYHYPGSHAILLIWTQWEGAVSVKNIALQRYVLLDIFAIAEGEGTKVMQTVGTIRTDIRDEAHTLQMKVQGVNQIDADRLKEEAFARQDTSIPEVFGQVNADSEYNYRPFRKVWFAIALCDHSAFMLSMANAAMFLDEARNPGTFQYEDSAEALRYYGQCVEQITARLSNPEDCTSEGVITTILGLICHDLYVGTLDRWAFHVRGLAQLARLRGGFHGMSKDIQLFACWFDVMGSVVRDQRPQLVGYHQYSATESTQSDPQSMSLHAISHEATATPPELAGVLETLKQSAVIAEFVNTHSDHPEFWRTEADLTPLQMLGPIMNQLLSLPRCEYPTASPYEIVRELARLSLLILTSELRRFYGMSAPEISLLNAKIYKLLKFIEARQEKILMPKLQLWAIITAALFQKSEMRMKSYVQLISLRMAMMDIRDGNAAVQLSRRIVWIDVVASQATVHNLISMIDAYQSKDI